MGWGCRPGALPSIIGTIYALLRYPQEKRTVIRARGGGFMTLPPGVLTGYPQVFERKRSVERLIRATERLEDRLDGLMAQVNELQSANKRLQLEWTETYDKVRHQLSRMARRGDLEKTTNGDEIVDPAADEDAGVDPISAKIHARRNRMFMGGK